MVNKKIKALLLAAALGLTSSFSFASTTTDVYDSVTYGFEYTQEGYEYDVIGSVYDRQLWAQSEWSKPNGKVHISYRTYVAILGDESNIGEAEYYSSTPVNNKCEVSYNTPYQIGKVIFVHYGDSLSVSPRIHVTP